MRYREIEISVALGLEVRVRYREIEILVALGLEVRSQVEILGN